MKDFSARVAAAIKDQGRAQNEVAISWREAATKRGARASRISTVESRLSELLKRKPKGLKFFLEKSVATEAMLDALGVTGDVRADLAASAELARAELANPKVRLVLDFAGLTEDRDECDELFREVESLMAGDRRRVPVLLLVETDQYRYMPRTLDEPIKAGDLRVEQLDSSLARARAASLAGNGALVLSPQDGLPATTSAAIAWSRTLEIEPQDAVERFFNDGSLPAVPVPQHRLEALGVEPIEVVCPDDLLARRRLRWQLAVEQEAAQLGLPAAQRLGLGLALGVDAASTARERIEHSIAQLVADIGVEAVVADAAGLDLLLKRAARRPVQPTVLRVGDHVHAINVAGGPDENPRLTRHSVEADRPALTALREIVTGWTQDQIADDPRLDAAVAALIEAGADRGAAWHARATLLWNDLIELKVGDSVDDPASALSVALRGPLPETELFLVTKEIEGELPDLSLGAYRAPGYRIQLESWIEGTPAAYRCSRLLATPPPVMQPRLGSSPAVVLPSLPNWKPARANEPGPWDEVPGPVDDRTFGVHWGKAKIPRWPATAIQSASDEIEVDDWLDAVDASPALGGRDGVEDLRQELLAANERREAAPQPSLAQRYIGSSRHRDAEVPQETQELLQRVNELGELAKRFRPDAELPESLPTAEIGQELQMEAALWAGRLTHGLRQALRGGRAVHLGDGRLLLQLGDGVEAEAWVRDHGPADAPLRVALDAVVGREFRLAMRRLHDSRWTGTSRYLALPTRLHLSGAGFAATLRFRQAPFEWAAGPPAPPHVPVEEDRDDEYDD